MKPHPWALSSRARILLIQFIENPPLSISDHSWYLVKFSFPTNPQVMSSDRSLTIARILSCWFGQNHLLPWVKDTRGHSVLSLSFFWDTSFLNNNKTKFLKILRWISVILPTPTLLPQNVLLFDLCFYYISSEIWMILWYL